MAILRKREKENEPSRRLRISVVDDDSHEQLYNFRTSRTNIIVSLAIVAVLIMLLSYCLTAFTGIRNTVPGYPSSETRLAAIDNMAKTDSLERVIEMWAFQVENIQRIVSGKEPLSLDSVAAGDKPREIDENLRARFAASDSLLRAEIRRQEEFNVSYGNPVVAQIEGLHFFTPVKGVITEAFDSKANHNYIDISAEDGATVYAVLDGSVISSSRDDAGGSVIVIQHDNNVISICRNAEKALKQAGDKVSAGTPVAITGKAGSASGTHIAFELWHEGAAVDPAAYIKF